MEYARNRKGSGPFIRYIRLFITSLILVFASHASARQFVITLDAGHGGKDYGAIGKITNEKTVTLNVVRQLGALIEKNMPDVKVVYTRTSDIFIPLAQRAEISNQAASDLFMSVHVNSVDKRNRRRTTIEGCQVYTLGLHKTAENLEVAKRENSVMELEDNNTARYADFDPNSLESDIVFELSQNLRLDQSIEFADAIHHQLAEVAGRAPKGVRQAGFWVLWATSAPAVLVELDFICNPTSERFLHSESGQEKMVAALYNAFCAYLNTYGSGIVGRRLKPAVPITPSGKKSAEARMKEYNYSQPATRPETETSEPDVSTSTNTIPQISRDKKEQYFIQILASASALPPEAKEFKGYTAVEFYLENNLYKYVIGPADNADDARRMLRQVRNDFPESFIVKIKNGERTGMIKP